MWSLRYMVLFLAENFLKVVRGFTIIESWAHEQLQKEDTYELLERDIEFIRERLGQMHQAYELGLPSTTQRIKRLEGDLAPGMHLGVLRDHLKVLCEAIEDDIEAQWFFCIPNVDVPLYAQHEQPFGWEVGLKFPDIEYDIAEAARCLAVDRSTATVFHLMRVMEWSVRRLAKFLRISTLKAASGKEKEWFHIVNEVRAKVNSMPVRTQAQREKSENLQALCNHLDGVRLAWRNNTMHPKASYEPHEAREIYTNVQTFMKGLADMLPHEG